MLDVPEPDDPILPLVPMPDVFMAHGLVGSMPEPLEMPPELPLSSAVVRLRIRA